MADRSRFGVASCGRIGLNSSPLRCAYALGSWLPSALRPRTDRPACWQLRVRVFEVAEADDWKLTYCWRDAHRKNDLKERVLSTGHPNSGRGDAGLQSRRRNGAERYAAHNSASRTATPGSATTVCKSALRHVRAFQYGHFSGSRMGRY